MQIITKLANDGAEQRFVKLTTRKELKQFLKDFDFHSGEWTDEDTTVSWYDQNGKFYHIESGERIPRHNKAKIKKLLEVGDWGCTFYGDVEVIFNENYGDWEVGAF